MISLDYKGKIVLVTGGGRGIGLGISRSFAEAGATIIMTYNSRDPTSVANALSKEFDVPVHSYCCPGEKSEVVNEVVDRIAKEVGEVDVVVANAGVSMWRDAIDMTDLELVNVMQTNLFAPIYLSRALVRHWLKLPTAVPSSQTPRGLRDEKLNLGKKILFISSISGHVSMSPQPQIAYNASKAGLTMAAKSLAGEWAQYGIAVNALSPGYVQTDMTTTDKETEHYPKKWKEMTPVDRFADIKEIGDMVVLMCSDRASTFMTGSDVILDGGYTIF